MLTRRRLAERSSSLSSPSRRSSSSIRSASAHVCVRRPRACTFGLGLVGNIHAQGTDERGGKAGRVTTRSMPFLTIRHHHGATCLLAGFFADRGLSADQAVPGRHALGPHADDSHCQRPGGPPHPPPPISPLPPALGLPICPHNHLLPCPTACYPACVCGLLIPPSTLVPLAPAPYRLLVSRS